MFSGEDYGGALEEAGGDAAAAADALLADADAPAAAPATAPAPGVEWGGENSATLTSYIRVQ